LDDFGILRDGTMNPKFVSLIQARRVPARVAGNTSYRYSLQSDGRDPIFPEEVSVKGQRPT
jgi:hypothetical protein